MIGKVVIALLFLMGVEAGRICEILGSHIQRGLIGSQAARFFKQHCHSVPTQPARLVPTEQAPVVAQVRGMTPDEEIVLAISSQVVMGNR